MEEIKRRTIQHKLNNHNFQNTKFRVEIYPASMNSRCEVYIVPKGVVDNYLKGEDFAFRYNNQMTIINKYQIYAFKYDAALMQICNQIINLLNKIGKNVNKMSEKDFKTLDTLLIQYDTACSNNAGW